jgi:CxxC motif-containing protein
MTVETTKLICITCPKGCTLQVDREGKTVIEVSGAGCKRGPHYVKAELTDPRRMVATTVKVKGGLHPLIPVYTSAPFPKPKIFDLLAELRQLEVEAPVTGGQVVLENALGTGINVITSRGMHASGWQVNPN